MTPKAVLFDCDGVLVDSEPITHQLLSDDLATRGLHISATEVHRLFLGGTMEGALQEARRLGADMPPDWVKEMYEKMFDALGREVEAFDGVSDLLDALIDRGVAIAVGSNGPARKMQITLGRTELLDRLQPHIYSARDLGRAKPAPDVYLHAARQLNVAPADCVVIEDSVSGAKAAQAARMRCIGFLSQGQSDPLSPHCQVIAQTMDDVARALGL